MIAFSFHLVKEKHTVRVLPFKVSAVRQFL